LGVGVPGFWLGVGGWGFGVSGFGFGGWVGSGLVLHDVLELDEVLREDQTVVEHEPRPLLWIRGLKRELFIDNLLVLNHFVVEMIW